MPSDDPTYSDVVSDPVLEDMRLLWKQADENWDECHDLTEFGGFVSADYV